MSNRNKKLYGTILTSVLFCVLLIILHLLNIGKTNDVRRVEDDYAEYGPVTENSSSQYSKDSFDGSILYKGNRYEVNRSLDKVLFLGVDSNDQKREGIGIDEGARSDTIILFIIDNDNEIITPLEINRDTMVDVDIYDNNGNYLAQGLEQITMQYSYGDTPRKACNLTKEKVSDLLGRTRINGVISLTIDGIEPIVDSIGGVTMKLTTDETQLSPSYTEGSVIHLDGTSAKAFVHDRDIRTRGSNITRMSRQTQFMLALFQNLKMNGSSVIKDMEEAAGDSLYKDIDSDTIEHFADYKYSEEVLTLPGTNETGNIHDEFYIDEDELIEMLIEIFYVKV